MKRLFEISLYGQCVYLRNASPVYLICFVGLRIKYEGTNEILINKRLQEFFLCFYFRSSHKRARTKAGTMDKLPETKSKNERIKTSAERNKRSIKYQLLLYCAPLQSSFSITPTSYHVQHA